MNIEDLIKQVEDEIEIMKQHNCHIDDGDEESIIREKDMRFGMTVGAERILKILKNNR